MINKFKIWFNRNNYRIMIIVLEIMIGYGIIYGLNKYFKEYSQADNNTQEIINNAYIKTEGDYLFKDKSNLETYQQIDSSIEEYKTAKNILNIIFNKIINARENNDESTKQELYNMCSDNFIKEMTTWQKAPNKENILDYYVGANRNNINKYYVGEIFNYYENKDIKGYLVESRCNIGNNGYENSYILIYVDYSTKAFLYGGGYQNLNGIDSTIDIKTISDKGGNTF